MDGWICTSFVVKRYKINFSQFLRLIFLSKEEAETSFLGKNLHKHLSPFAVLAKKQKTKLQTHNKSGDSDPDYIPFILKQVFI